MSTSFPLVSMNERQCRPSSSLLPLFLVKCHFLLLFSSIPFRRDSSVCFPFYDLFLRNVQPAIRDHITAFSNVMRRYWGLYPLNNTKLTAFSNVTGRHLGSYPSKANHNFLFSRYEAALRFISVRGKVGSIRKQRPKIIRFSDVTRQHYGLKLTFTTTQLFHYPTH